MNQTLSKEKSDMQTKINNLENKLKKSKSKASSKNMFCKAFEEIEKAKLSTVHEISIKLSEFSISFKDATKQAMKQWQDNETQKQLKQFQEDIPSKIEQGAENLDEEATKELIKLFDNALLSLFISDQKEKQKTIKELNTKIANINEIAKKEVDKINLLIKNSIKDYEVLKKNFIEWATKSAELIQNTINEK